MTTAQPWNLYIVHRTLLTFERMWAYKKITLECVATALWILFALQYLYLILGCSRTHRAKRYTDFNTRAYCSSHFS